MKTFKDNSDRGWNVAINVESIKRVKTLLGVNLLDVLDEGGKLLARLHDDPLFLVDALYCVCKPEADQRQVTDEDFGRAMFGDAILHGAEALLEELADFFPDARRRAAIREVMHKMRATAERLLDHARQTIAGIDPVQAAAKLIDSLGSSPALSASTQAP